MDPAYGVYHYDFQPVGDYVERVEGGKQENLWNYPGWRIDNCIVCVAGRIWEFTGRIEMKWQIKMPSHLQNDQLIITIPEAKIELLQKIEE
jgi:hypothetical protein